METTNTVAASENVNGRARFKTAHDAMQFLMNHPNGQYDRRHDVLTVKNPSLRCMAAIDYLKKCLGKHALLFIRVRDGEAGVWRTTQFAAPSDTTETEAMISFLK